jgi:putative ABC transport system ATP-binding protein
LLLSFIFDLSSQSLPAMFHISQLIPIPLKEQNIGFSEVWKTELDIQAATRCFISAPSGKGKTTLQLIFYGIRKDYEGNVTLDGRNIKDFGLNDWAEIRQKRLSIIFQDLRLFPNLTAWENLKLKNMLTDFKTEAQIKEMAERLGVAEFLSKPAGILSYGQRQRMAIVRAMCQPFELLLMDEPFSHLDAENIKKSCELIAEECKSQGAGYLIASLGDTYTLEYDRTVKL